MPIYSVEAGLDNTNGSIVSTNVSQRVYRNNFLVRRSSGSGGEK